MRSCLLPADMRANTPARARTASRGVAGAWGALRDRDPRIAEVDPVPDRGSVVARTLSWCLLSASKARPVTTRSTPWDPGAASSCTRTGDKPSLNPPPGKRKKGARPSGCHVVKESIW